jgi:hypothetical protein
MVFCTRFVGSTTTSTTPKYAWALWGERRERERRRERKVSVKDLRVMGVNIFIVY